MQLVQVEQHGNSGNEPCAVCMQQHLQQARPLDVLCISSNATITRMHGAGYPPKVQQPVRKTLMQLTVATREEGVWLVHPCFIGVSTWGQAEPAPPGWPASQHLSVTQVMPVSLSCRCHVQAAFVEDSSKLATCLVHQHVVHVLSASFLYCALARAQSSPLSQIAHVHMHASCDLTRCLLLGILNSGFPYSDSSCDILDLQAIVRTC